MRPLTIGIEATLAGARSAERSGIYRYLQQLLLGFRAVGGSHRFRLWFNTFRARNLDGVPEFFAGVNGLRAEAVVSRFPARVRDRLGIPADCFTGPLDVFHSPSHLLPRLRRTPGVVTIHDLAFLRMAEDVSHLNPDWSAAIRRRSRHPQADLSAHRARCGFFLNLQRNIWATLARADAIVAVSEATARDLEQIAGVPRAKVRVVPNGTTPGMGVVRDRDAIRDVTNPIGVDGRYVLYVGVLDPNKDLHTLIAAYASTSPAFRREHWLVIAGPESWFQPVLEEEAERQGVADQVRFAGFVPDAMLPALYSGATMVVSPSPLEGFGLTVLEAMACGAPMIVVDAGALPEVAGDAAIRVPPRDPASLASALERIASDSDLAMELVTRGFIRCKAFSWERTAKMTLELYAEVAG